MPSQAPPAPPSPQRGIVVVAAVSSPPCCCRATSRDYAATRPESRAVCISLRFLHRLEAVVATANPFFRFAVGSSGWEMERPTTRRALVVATAVARFVPRMICQIRAHDEESARRGYPLHQKKNPHPSRAWVGQSADHSSNRFSNPVAGSRFREDRRNGSPWPGPSRHPCP